MILIVPVHGRELLYDGFENGLNWSYRQEVIDGGCTALLDPAFHRDGEYSLRLTTETDHAIGSYWYTIDRPGDNWSAEWWMMLSCVSYGCTEESLMIFDQNGVLSGTIIGSDQFVRDSYWNIASTKRAYEWLRYRIENRNETRYHYVYNMIGDVLWNSTGPVMERDGIGKVRIGIRGWNKYNWVWYDEIHIWNDEPEVTPVPVPVSPPAIWPEFAIKIV